MNIVMGGLEFFCLTEEQSPECQRASSVSESILAATRIAGGGERKRQVMDSDHSKYSIEANIA